MKISAENVSLLLIKALELCNDSRNRLTRFQSSPDFWLREAQAEMEKKPEVTHAD